MSDKKYPIAGYAPGGYQRTCASCSTLFLGDKRAFQCEPCAVRDHERYEALTPEEKDAHDKRFAEAAREVFKQFNSRNNDQP